jgi:hypothetical protein
MGFGRYFVTFTAASCFAALLSGCNDSDMNSGNGVTGGRTASSAGPTVRHQGSSKLDGVKSVKAGIGNGNITVRPALLGRQVNVEWEVKPTGGKYGDRVEDLDVVCELKADGRLEITEVWKGPLYGNRPQVELTITMPRDLPLSTSVGNGSVDAECDAQFTANVGNGNVVLAGAPTGSEISIGNGRLKSSCALTGGSHEVAIGNGSATVALASGSSVSLDAATSVGRARGDGFSSHRGQYSPGGSLGGKLGEGLASLSVRIGNGNITVDGQPG